MRTPLFNDNEFLSQDQLNTAAGLVSDSLEDITSALHTPGLIAASSLSFSYSNLTITVDAPLPFMALFSDGTLASANGTVDGSTSSSATVDFSSLVPSTGNVTAYLVAVSGSVAQSPTTTVGPPVGHPDFSPSFQPYTAYNDVQGTLIFSATTTAPDNTDTLLICSTVLSAGQTTITTSSTVGQARAGAILSRNGEVLATDLASGAAASNVGTLGGSLVGTLPNPTLAATGANSGTYINPVTITVDEDGRISDIANVDNFDVPGNVTAGGNASVDGEITAASAQVNGLVTIEMNGGAGGMLLLADTTSGQSTANKSIRSDSGELQVVNSAYSSTILSLTDSGDLSVPGTGNFGGEVTVAPATQNNAAVQLGQITDGSIDAEFGNLTATGSTSLQAVSAITGSFSGEVTVAPATQNNAAVQFSQMPQVYSNYATTSNSTSLTGTLSFTPPYNGNVLWFIQGSAGGGAALGDSTTSVSGATSVDGNPDIGNSTPTLSGSAEYSVTAGTAASFSFTLHIGTATGLYLSMVAILVPTL